MNYKSPHHNPPSFGCFHDTWQCIFVTLAWLGPRRWDAVTLPHMSTLGTLQWSHSFYPTRWGSRWNNVFGSCTVTKGCCLLLQHQLNPACKHNAVFREIKGSISAGSSLRWGHEKPYLVKTSPNKASGLEYTNNTRNSLIFLRFWETYRSTRLHNSLSVIYKSKQTWPTWVSLIFKGIPNVSGCL